MPDAISGGASAPNAGVRVSDGEHVLRPEAVKELASKEVPEDHPEQLRDTGNGPTISYEESLLEEFYGKPNEHGLYGVISDAA